MVNNFQKIIEDLSGDLQKVDQIISEFAVGKSPLIQEISTHLISSGGKRIRPILLILATRLQQSESSKKSLNLAAAVELIHSATLLHDDVVDAGLIRRGKKTANAIWDNKVSILVGDYLFSIAFQLMVQSKNLEVLALLSKASSIMADGEVMQLENSNDLTLSEEKYFEIIFGKTAILFSAACEAGALISDASTQEIQALSAFGKNLGIIFQIVDDILDYSAKEQVFGKEAGHDFFEGKVTLPLIITYKKSNEVERKFLSGIFAKNLFGEEKDLNDFEKILELIAKHEGLEESKNKAMYYKNMALNNLEIFSSSKAKQDLINVLEYSLARIF
jgi:octaprenyl-diphosphate synthase